MVKVADSAAGRDLVVMSMNLANNIFLNDASGTERIVVKRCQKRYGNSIQCTKNVATYMASQNVTLLGLQECQDVDRFAEWMNADKQKKNYRTVRQEMVAEKKAVCGIVYDADRVGIHAPISMPHTLDQHGAQYSRQVRSVSAAYFPQKQLVFASVWLNHEKDNGGMKLAHVVRDLANEIVTKVDQPVTRIILTMDSNDYTGSLKDFTHTLHDVNGSALTLKLNGQPQACCEDSAYEFPGDYIMDTDAGNEVVLVEVPMPNDRLMSDHMPVRLARSAAKAPAAKAPAAKAPAAKAPAAPAAKVTPAATAKAAAKARADWQKIRRAWTLKNRRRMRNRCKKQGMVWVAKTETCRDKKSRGRPANPTRTLSRDKPRTKKNRRVVAVAVHDHGNERYPHCMLLRSDGTVSGIGNNSHGQLGLGDTRNRKAFTTLRSVSNVTAIASGEAHTVFLHADGTVSTVGSQGCESGEPGVPQQPQLHAPVRAIACGYSHTVLLHTDGSVSVSSTTPAFQVVPGLCNITAIGSAANTVLALHRNGTVSAWGEDGAGMGLGRCASKAEEVALKKRGYPKSCANRNVDTPRKVPGLKNVVALGATGYHGLFLHKDGTVSSVGSNNNHGQLGVGDKKPHLVPRRVEGLRDVVQLLGGYSSSAAVHKDGNISIWGTSVNYRRYSAIQKRLDVKNGVFDLLTPVQVPPDNRAAARAVAIDSTSIIYVTRTGSVQVISNSPAAHLTRIFQPPAKGSQWRPI